MLASEYTGPASWTLALGVRNLQPTHVLTAGLASSIRIRRIWCPTGRPKLNMRPDEITERLGYFGIASVAVEELR